MKDLEKTIDKVINNTDRDISQENANTDGTSPMGIMGLVASEASREYNKKFLTQIELDAYEEGFIHIHDFDFYGTGTTTCCQIPLGDVLKRGFTVGECNIRPPQTIGSAMALASILLQANQNQQHGGQAYPNFDFDLAPYVQKSYDKILEKLNKYGIKDDKVQKIAEEEIEKEVYQACEAFIHNANSMLTRNGMQVPFVSVNFGLDTSYYGRLITKNMLKAQMAGLGDGATPIFPILIFKIKEGVNFNKGDKNYDLYELSLECLSKRLFPNFQFIDTPFNEIGFDLENPNTHIATMGCRTRIFEDVNGPRTPVGRGNLSFTSLNLPMIAQKSKIEALRMLEDGDDLNDLTLECFNANLTYYGSISCLQLLKRYEYQKSRDASSFKLLYGDKTWSLDTGQKHVGERLDSGSLALGYIGLAEALVILTGKHHGESEDSQKLGLNIIQSLNDITNLYRDCYKLNFSVIATPAEGLAGKSLRKFKEKYGHLDKVTDYDFFTNSNHVPVYYNISAADKIAIEGPYHALTLGGHISYIEVDGDTQNNLEALDDIVKLMFKHNVGYGSINTPVDRCRDCGFHQYIEDTCPMCGSANISRIRRITGYLVGDMDKWNSGKLAEEKNRVKHTKGLR